MNEFINLFVLANSISCKEGLLILAVWELALYGEDKIMQATDWIEESLQKSISQLK